MFAEDEALDSNFAKGVVSSTLPSPKRFNFAKMSAKEKSSDDLSSVRVSLNDQVLSKGSILELMSTWAVRLVKH